MGSNTEKVVTLITKRRLNQISSIQYLRPDVSRETILEKAEEIASRINTTVDIIMSITVERALDGERLPWEPSHVQHKTA